MKISCVDQTPFLKRGKGGLMQLLRVRFSLSEPCAVEICLDGETVHSGDHPAGEAVVEFYRAEPREERQSSLMLRAGGEETQFCFATKLPKRLSEHVVQLSHHDLGYTDIPSRVLSGYNRAILELLEMADVRNGVTGDSRLRVVLEQAWSVDHFLNTAAPADRERLMARIRAGDFEVNALYGNQITEIMGHEETYRLMYPSAAIAQEAGVPLISAEYNDITDFSWGLCRALPIHRGDLPGQDYPPGSMSLPEATIANRIINVSSGH